MKRLKKRINTLAMTIIILLGIYICARGFSMIMLSGMENPFNSAMGSINAWVSKSVMKTYMPSVIYRSSGKNEKGAVNKVLGFIFEDIPIYKYVEENSGYETEDASEYTYEMIIAAEAADENYVNHETGEVIINEGLSTENEADTSDGKTEQSSDSVNIQGEDNANEKNDSEGQIKGADEEAADNEKAEEDNIKDNKNSESDKKESSEAKEPDNGDTAQETIADVKGTVYSIEKLSDFDFLKNTFYSVDSTTSVNSERLNARAMLEKDLTIQQDNTVPQILIYHTHSQETFSDSTPGDVSTSIVGVGSYLSELLADKYGYNVIHNTSTYDMVDGKLDRNYAYTLAEPDITKILKENPSIQVVIDLHRDGVNENTHLATEVNGKPAAKIMFFNGLSYNSKVGNIEYLYNPYIEDNLAFSFQMQLKAAAHYPEFTRKIYLKGYRYNLHLMPRATVIEVGGQTNTVEEAKNAMEPLADILDKVLKGIE